MADTKAPRKIALALQGGGSHGAFTWGVLDRILEDETLEIIGVTGTSAGAMNAVVMADGLVRGGREDARLRLRQFWEAIGMMPGFATLLGSLSGEFQAQMHLEQTPAYQAWDALARNLSPYDLNPFNFNPLRDPLIKLVDFDRLRAQQDLELMVCATNVFTSRRRVFGRKDISVDAVLASACLPQMFPAIEIDGEPYWDGGFSGNPAMAPPAPKVAEVRLYHRADRPDDSRDPAAHPSRNPGSRDGTQLQHDVLAGDRRARRPSEAQGCQTARSRALRPHLIPHR
jgi:NTE family protein